jgi:SAM-dependent methyltransferase
MKNWIRWWLRKLTGHEVLILRPDWKVLAQSEQYQIIGREGGQRYLPMHYNYQTEKEWRFVYRIRGNASGKLEYRLGTPREGTFFETQTEVRLPMDFVVSLADTGMLVNDRGVPGLPGKSIPRETVVLRADFRFQSDQGETLLRQTGHRVRLTGGPTDERYFCGLIYDAYDERSASLPKAILEIVQQYHPLQGKLLDIGCATGLLVEYALKLGLDADGVDFSAWAIEQANARAPGRCRTLDLDRAHAQDFSSTYDLIILNSVLEHLQDPERALKLLFQISRPRAVIYLETLNADSLMHRLLEKDWAGYQDYTHQSPWISADWLELAARRAGFRVVSLKRHGVWNDKGDDEVWAAFSNVIQLHPANVILQDHFGDLVQAILEKPGD